MYIKPFKQRACETLIYMGQGVLLILVGAGCIIGTNYWVDQLLILLK